MTDNEIIKALECCTTSNCGECPIFNNKEIRKVPGRCVVTLEKNALDLINRQKAENERLQKENEILSANADNAFQEGLNENRELFKEEVEKGIRAEAVKEFAERLKKELYKIPQHHFTLLAVEEVIDKEKEKAGATK